jgi:hypothetical protein
MPRAIEDRGGQNEVWQDELAPDRGKNGSSKVKTGLKTLRKRARAEEPE